MRRDVLQEHVPSCYITAAMEEPSRGKHFLPATYSMKSDELELVRQWLARRQNYPDVQSIQSVIGTHGDTDVACSGRSDREVARNGVSPRCHIFLC